LMAATNKHQEARDARMQRLHGMRGVALAVAITALAGCGGSDDGSPAAPKASTPKTAPAVTVSERGILATVDALQTASRKGDGRAVCVDLFTPQLVKSVEASAKRSCAKEVRKRMFAPDAEISVGRDIKVTGNRGIAVVREQNGNVSKLSLVRQSAQWRIDGVRPVTSG
jgi:hypothetical protein